MEDYPLKKMSIYYDDTFSESFEAEFFDKIHIESIASKFKDIFKSLLKNEYVNNFESNSLSIVDSMYETQANKILENSDCNNKTDLSIARFYMLTNIIELFRVKCKKWLNNDFAIIKIG